MLPLKRRDLSPHYYGGGTGNDSGFNPEPGTNREKRRCTSGYNSGNHAPGYWLTLGSGAMFGTGTPGGQKYLPKELQVSSNMKTSHHGWKVQNGVSQISSLTSSSFYIRTNLYHVLLCTISRHPIVRIAVQQ